ncbi:MAG: ATP-binding cassette domain-containing protein [Spirosomataceae bacterium]
MAQIKFDNIDLAFGNNAIIESFNLSIEKGEIVTFFGPSGCGKSSIMKMVLGINTPTHGNVTIGDVEASQYQQPISYVPQDNELLPWLSVKDNIEIWSKNVVEPGLSSSEVLQMVDLEKHAHKLPSVLSGGMSRRTALARGLATKSDILCFDEAMVGIEKTMRHKLLINLRNYIKKSKATAIFISHDYEETIFLSDRIIVFTPPPAVISKIINVDELYGNTDRQMVKKYGKADFVGMEFFDVDDRDTTFIHSQLFKDIYNQMLTS